MDIITTPPDIKVHVKSEHGLLIRAIVLSDKEQGDPEARNFLLEERDAPYDLTLIQNPLVDYDRIMGEVQRLIDRRHAFLTEHQDAEHEPPDCSLQQIRGLWSVAHWYQVTEYTYAVVGMSVAVWEGENRNNNKISFVRS